MVLRYESLLWRPFGTHTQVTGGTFFEFDNVWNTYITAKIINAYSFSSNFFSLFFGFLIFWVLFLDLVFLHSVFFFFALGAPFFTFILCNDGGKLDFS